MMPLYGLAVWRLGRSHAPGLLPGQSLGSHCVCPSPDSYLSGMVESLRNWLWASALPPTCPSRKTCLSLRNPGQLPPSTHQSWVLGHFYPVSFAPHTLQRLGYQFHDVLKPQLQFHVPHLLMTLPLSGLSKLVQAFACCHLICSKLALFPSPFPLPAFLGISRPSFWKPESGPWSLDRFAHRLKAHGAH